LRRFLAPGGDPKVVDDEADVKPKGQFPLPPKGALFFALLSPPAYLAGLTAWWRWNDFDGTASTGNRGGEEEDKVLSEPDPASGMTEPTPNNKDASGHKSDLEMLG
jgi:hypothetical protein